MQKLLLTALVIFGVWCGFTFFYPAGHHVVFMVTSTFGITYAMFVEAALGIVAWRNIK